MKNTTAIQHTQGEWYNVNSSPKDDNKNLQINIIQYGQSGKRNGTGTLTLATVKADAVWNYSNEEAEANAAHIVNCVNSHEALINALEVVLWDMENGEAEAQKQGRPRFMQRQMIVEQALIKAK